MTFDIIIKGGTILDGVRNEGYLADIGVTKDKIKAVGNLSRFPAKTIISAENKYVSPGFVDIQNHSDSYLTLIETPALPSLVSQGITTIAVGHCGASLGPLPNLEALRSVQKWHSIAGANLNWLNFSEYLATLDNYPLGLNVTSLAGHATVRRGLLKDEIRPATPEEIQIETKIFRESLEAGAAGLSMGLVYAHEVSSNAEELLTVSQTAASRNKLLSVHLRSESSHVAQAVSEVIGLAEAAKSRAKISHFKIRSQKNWPLFEEVIASLERAYEQGVDIFFDVYPYTTSWSVLYTYLPKWAYEGGGKKLILQNLASPDNRSRIISHLKPSEQSFKDILIATSETNPAFVGKTIGQIAENQEISVSEALLNVISGTGAQVEVFDHNLSEEILMALLKHPLSVVATDGAGYDLSPHYQEGLVHPRCFGAIPKFLSIVRDKKILSWGEAIKKITSRPADKLGLKSRGKLAEGHFADIVVLDPHDVGSKASYQNPYIQSDGVDWVLVNGKIAVQAGEVTRLAAGKVLRV